MSACQQRDVITKAADWGKEGHSKGEKRDLDTGEDCKQEIQVGREGGAKNGLVVQKSGDGAGAKVLLTI